jgi:CheY-like chemotaxis protein
MFEPLYRHLQSLSQEITTLPREINQQLQAIFEAGIENQSIPNPDYLAICWLVNQKYISPSQAAILIEHLALEVLQTFLVLEEGSYEFIPESFLDDLPKFCYLNLRLLVEQCQQRGNVYEGFTKDADHHETSAYKENMPTTVNSRQSYHTYPKPKTEPRLPNIEAKRYTSPYVNTNHGYQQMSSTDADRKVYKIFCIDDNTMILNTIKNCLDEQIFSVIGVTDAVKALMEILHTKPDIIFLDVDMPGLDGYELCSLLRKHSYFKNTPVIMMTAKAGLIGKVKAKIAGANGYLIKTFTHGDLLKVIFKHIM